MSAPEFPHRSGWSVTAEQYQDLAVRYDALTARVKVLEGLVFVAYQEGWAAAGGHWGSNSGWETSEARAALSTAQEE